MTHKILAVIGVFVSAIALPQVATADKYHVTDAEQSACIGDAMSLCANAGHDEDKLLICMQANRKHLGAGCRTVFDEGLRRRGIR